MKRIIVSTLIFAAGGFLFSQQIPFFSQYYINPLVYNPSLTGSTDDVRLFLTHKSQWKGMPGAPVSTSLTIDGPISDKNIGIGFGLYRDAIDISDNMGLYTSYSYRININSDHVFLTGVSFGVIDKRIDFSRVIARDANDPFLFGQQQRSISFDATLGASYRWKALEAGFAFPQLIGNSLEFDDNRSKAYYNLLRHYLFTVKYAFTVQQEKDIIVYPQALVRFVPGAPVQYDFNAVLDWKSMGWFAASYKSDYAIGLNLGLRLKTSLSAGYAYDFIIGPVGNYSGAGHEILLSYTFGRGPKEDPAEKQALVNQLNQLAAENAGNKSEVEVLKKDMESLKSSNDSLLKVKIAATPRVYTAPTHADSAGAFRKGSVSDYKDENGASPVQAGYYTIVGSFKKRDLAENAKIKFTVIEFEKTKVMFSQSSQLNYVFIGVSDTYEKAKEMVKNVKAFAPDAWILELK